MSKTALLEWTGFEGLPDFSKIHDEDFKPAFEEALKDAEAEIEQIAASPEPATIDGFLQSFELAGKSLDHDNDIRLFFCYELRNIIYPIIVVVANETG